MYTSGNNENGVNPRVVLDGELRPVAMASTPERAVALAELLTTAEANKKEAESLNIRVLEVEDQLLIYRRLQPHVEAIATILYAAPTA